MGLIGVTVRVRVRVRARVRARVIMRSHAGLIIRHWKPSRALLSTLK